MDDNTASVLIVAIVAFLLVGIAWTRAWKDRIYYATKAERDRAAVYAKAHRADTKADER